MFYLSDLTNSISFLYRLSYMRDANNLYIIKIIHVTAYEFKFVPIVHE